MFPVHGGVWFVICHHMVSLWCSPERCEAQLRVWQLHHYSAYQTEHKKSTGWKLDVFVFSCDKRKGKDSGALFLLSSVIWEWDPVSQPGRKQVLSPVVLLSHYASYRLKVEPAPVNVPQWLWKLSRKLCNCYCNWIFFKVAAFSKAWMQLQTYSF